MIKSLNFEIIDICNLKCKMCNIWENKNPNYLSEKDIENILNSEYIKNDVDITITGGEPLIHKDIKKLTQKIYSLGFKISTISTNGIFYEKLKDLLDFYILNNYHFPNIHISVDGDEETHDKQRGVVGSFKKSIKTILKLKKEFKDIKIKIKYTITKDNFDTIEYIYTLSKKLKVDVSFKIVENDINYTNTINSPNLLNSSEKDLIYKKLIKIYKNENKYINNLLYYIKNNKLNFDCTTPKENLFIMANGDVYPCTKYNSIGNIKDKNIIDILFNETHNKIIKEVKETKCNKCFSLHGSYKTII